MTEAVQGFLSQLPTTSFQTFSWIVYCNAACLGAAIGINFTYDLEINPSGTQNPSIAWAYFSGVNQTTPIVQTETAVSAVPNTVTTISVANVTVEAGGLVVYGAVADDDPSGGGPHWTEPAGFTEVQDRPNVTNSVFQVTAGFLLSPTAQTLTTPTLTHTDPDELVMAMASFRAAAAPATDERRPVSVRIIK